MLKSLPSNIFRMTIKALMLAPLILLVSHAANSRELTDMSLEIVSAKTGNEAKQEAFDQATDEATRRLTEELLGPERTAKVWTSIRPKLLKNSSRYVQFIKGGPIAENNGQTRVQVQMRISSDNLESLLREMGALGTGTIRLLPLVVVSEPRGTRYVWWADASEEKTETVAQEAFKKFYQSLAAKFKGKNVYVLDPTNASFRMGVPSAYRSEGLRREDQILLAQYLKADVVLSGKVDIVKAEGAATKINYDLQMWQGKAGRGLSEVQRSEAAGGDQPKALLASLEQANDRILPEFASKLHEAIMAGSLNLNVIRITVEGQLPYKNQVEFKKQLETLREIKILRERLFEPSRVTFEAETNTTGGELAKSVQKAKFPQYRVDVEGSQDHSLVLSVKALSPSSAQ